jgi:hypothetical protein
MAHSWGLLTRIATVNASLCVLLKAHCISGTRIGFLLTARYTVSSLFENCRAAGIQKTLKQTIHRKHQYEQILSSHCQHRCIHRIRWALPSTN